MCGGIDEVSTLVDIRRDDRGAANKEIHAEEDCPRVVHAPDGEKSDWGSYSVVLMET